MLLPESSSSQSKVSGALSIEAAEKAVPKHNESRKFLTDVLWVGIGQVFVNMTGLAVLPALTKTYTTEAYGVWAQMVVTIGFLKILTMKFESATIRFLAAEDDADKRRRAMGTMMWPIMAVMLVTLGISVWLRQGLAVWLYTSSGYVVYVPLVVLWASLEALFFFAISYQRSRGKIKTFASMRLASSVSRMVAIVSLAVLGFDFYRLVVSVIFIQGLFTVGALAMVVAELGILPFNLGGLKKFLLYSMPLIPGEILFWVINVSDRYFIAHMINISETGIYSASCSLANLLMMISWPIGMALFPAVSRLWDQGNHEKVKSYFQYSMKLFLVLSVPAAVGMFILSQPLLGILTTPEFQAGGTLVLLLAVGVVFAGVFQLNEYTIYLAKRTTVLPLINGAGAVINVGVNIVLIPRLGIMAAAISTIIAYFAVSVILVFWSRKVVDYKLDLVFTLKIIAATAVMAASLWFIKVDSIAGIILVILIGASVYAAALLVLRTFTSQDIRMAKSAVSGLGTKFKR